MPSDPIWSLLVLNYCCIFRWAQATEELKQALCELEEEKIQRRHVEEEMNLKANEQDKLKNKLSALIEEREKESPAMLMGEEAAETCLLVHAYAPLVEGDKLVGEPKNEKEAAVPSHPQQHEFPLVSLQQIKQASPCAEQSQEPRDDHQLQTLQVYQHKWVCVSQL